MGWYDYFESAASQPMLAWFLRLVALIPLYGAWHHLSNVFGRRHRRAGTDHWPGLDAVLLLVDITLAVGLIVGAAWAVAIVIVGFIAFQATPHMGSPSLFAPTPTALRRLLRIQLVTLLILAVLLVFSR